MVQAQNIFSPRSSSGSFLLSIFVHVALAAGLVFVLGLHPNSKAPAEDYVDLGYQTFDEPPVPAQEQRPVVKAEPKTPVETKAIPDNSPKEMQDEKSDVAGAQKAAPVEDKIGADTNGTAASTPYYKIKPKYPKAALVAGTEGWVLMKIDINETGEVENVRVVDGEQRNLFQSEARRAVSQWKYRPFTDETGKPFRKADHQVRVDFKLQDIVTN